MWREVSAPHRYVAHGAATLQRFANLSYSKVGDSPQLVADIYLLESRNILKILLYMFQAFQILFCYCLASFFYCLFKRGQFSFD